MDEPESDSEKEKHLITSSSSSASLSQVVQPELRPAPTQLQSALLQQNPLERIASEASLSYPNQPEQKQVVEKDGKPVLVDQTNLLPPRQVILIFLGISCAMFCSQLDQTIVSTALPSIGKDFGASKSSSWVATSYTMGSTICMPLYGRMSDIFGRKSVLLASLGFFWAGSLLCAVSQTLVQLIVFRAFAGVGGGGILSVNMIIISDIVSMRERGKYQGIAGVIIAIGTSIGPIIGGLFTSVPIKRNWALCFWINVPLTLASILICTFALPLKKVGGNMVDKLKLVDWLGSAISLLSTVLILIPISWGGSEYAWSSAGVLAPLIIGVALVGFFVWIELRATLPVMPMRFFLDRTVTGVMITTFISGLIFYAQYFYFPQFFQVVLRVSSLRSAVLLLPLILPQTFFNFLSGYVMTWTGEYKFGLIAGFTVWTIGLGLITTFNKDISVGKLIGFQIIAGAGAGQTFQTSLTAAQAAVARSDMASVTTLRNFFRMLGGVFALAICTALNNNAVSTHLNSSDLFSPTLLSSIMDQPTEASTFQLTSTQYSAVIEAYTLGFHHIIYLCCPAAAIGVIATIFLIKPYSLTRDDDNDQKEQAKQWLQDRKAQKQKTDVEQGAVTEKLPPP